MPLWEEERRLLYKDPGLFLQKGRRVMLEAEGRMSFFFFFLKEQPLLLLLINWLMQAASEEGHIKRAEYPHHPHHQPVLQLEYC